MKKRILSIILAILLIAIMAIPVSATTIQSYPKYDNECDYFTQDYCVTYSYSSLMEFIYTSNNEKTYADYTFQIDVGVYDNSSILLLRSYSPSRTMLTSISGNTPIAIKFIEAAHYINSEYIDRTKVYS